jgi:hypothetical protein
MPEEKDSLDRDQCESEGPQTTLEKLFFEEYLKEKGLTLEKLRQLPPAEAQKYMREASLYASLKLAEVESRARFHHEIHHDLP